MKARRRDESHYRVLQGVVITEKATTLADDARGEARAFMFDVSPAATKPQVRAAVEHVFGVKVAAVRIHNIKGKARNVRHRRGGNRRGSTATRRRAIVRLVAGHDIDFLKLGGGA